MSGPKTVVEIRVPCALAGFDRAGRKRTHRVTVVMRTGQLAQDDRILTTTCSCSSAESRAAGRTLEVMSTVADPSTCSEWARRILAGGRAIKDCVGTLNQAGAARVGVEMALGGASSRGAQRLRAKLAQRSIGILPRNLEDRRALADLRRAAKGRLRPAIESIRWSSVEGWRGWWVRVEPRGEGEFLRTEWVHFNDLKRYLYGRGRTKGYTFHKLPDKCLYTGIMNQLSVVMIGLKYCRLCKTEVHNTLDHATSSKHLRATGELQRAFTTLLGELLLDDRSDPFNTETP